MRPGRPARSPATFFRLSAVLLAAWACTAAAPPGVNTENFGGRSMIVTVPSTLPASGTRALVIVLHGGLGNAQRIEAGESEHGLNMDAVAGKSGFVVAYLNGTPVTRFLGADKLGWNAGGGCCGQPAINNVDDVAYLTRAVDHLVGEYGIDPRRVYGMGHSNGAMMVQRLMCETDVLQAIVAISGPLNLNSARCPAAREKRILALHGADDENVPVAGGRGSRGLSGVAYRSEESSRESFTSSGASYDLQIVKGADHQLDHIEAAIQRTEAQTIAEKAAAYFRLVDSGAKGS